jgi:ketosteroid isomerase-like protein
VVNCSLLVVFLLAITHYTLPMTSEVLAANTAFYRAFEKKDIEAMSVVWSQGTGSLCIHPGWNVLRGWKDVRTSWEQIFKNTAYIEINTDIITTEVRDNIACIVLVENVFQVIEGRRIQAQSMATNVFELLGGKWYLIHHHGSPIMR